MQSFNYSKNISLILNINLRFYKFLYNSIFRCKIVDGNSNFAVKAKALINYFCMRKFVRIKYREKSVLVSTIFPIFDDIFKIYKWDNNKIEFY